MKKPTNKFVIEVSAHLPYDGKETASVNRWLNLQYTGKEIVASNEKVSQKHKDAAWKLHDFRRYKMEFEIDKTGEWKFLRIL